jgi:hypothetical protein
MSKKVLIIIIITRKLNWRTSLPFMTVKEEANILLSFQLAIMKVLLLEKIYLKIANGI